MLGLEKAEITSGQITSGQTANICWIMKKAKEFQKKKHLFCFAHYSKAFDCVDHNKFQKILQEIGVPDHFI